MSLCTRLSMLTTSVFNSSLKGLQQTNGEISNTKKPHLKQSVNLNTDSKFAVSYHQHLCPSFTLACLLLYDNVLVLR